MPSKKCEICGEDVDNLKFKRHMQSHAESNGSVEVKKESVVEEPKKVEDKLNSKLSPEMSDLVKIARARQASMLEAPSAFFSEDGADKHKALRKVHCPESFGKNPKFECMFGDAKKSLEGYAAMGYEPVFDGKGNIVKDSDGNPMFRMPKELYQKRKAVAQKESSNRLRSVVQQSKRISASKGVEAPSGVEFAEEELSIKRVNGD